MADGIRVVLITGSVRPESYSAKAVALVRDEFATHHSDVALEVFDPATLTLAQPGMPGTPDGDKLRASVKRATGVILETPEYHGSFSSVIKLVIENLGFPSSLAGKPVALLGVAAGQIGAIKSLEGLASICTHVGAIVLPGAVSIANVQKVFDKDGRCLDPVAEKRIRAVATNLRDYINRAICPSVALEAMVRSGS